MAVRALRQFAIFAVLSTPRIALSQRQTYTNTNAWFVFNADVALNEKWAVLFDASARRSGTFDEPMANFVRLSHRYRLEQRFRGRRNDPAVDRIDYWERSNRFRYQVRGTLPLSGDAIETGEMYLTASNEIFIGIGRNVQYNIFDQDRATFSVGYRLTRHWRTQAGFLEQVIFKSNGIDVERNHTLTLTLFFSRPPALRPIGVTPSR